MVDPATILAHPKNWRTHGPEQRAALIAVALVSRALVNSSLPGDVILDPFLGAGSTLIAAESMGRACYGMDIEPRYVQVAIERWQAFTGREALREVA